MTKHLIAATGLACIVFGAWLVHPALAWFTTGGALVALSQGMVKLEALGNRKAEQTK